MTCRNWLPGIGAAFALVATGALAADEASLREAFAVLDSNGDGVVSEAEFEQNKVKVFFSTLEEMAQDKSLDFEETRLNRTTFDSADTNQDGQLSGAEWVLSDFAQFNTYDPDGSGVIDYEEFAAGIRPFLR